MIYSFEPKQDLHGYAEPWAPGAGKNLFPNGESATSNGVTFTVNDDGSVTVSGKATGGVAFFRIGQTDPVSLPAGTYYASGIGTSQKVTMAVYKQVGGSDTSILSGEGSFTLEEETAIWLRFRVGENDTASGTLYPMIEAGSAKTSYEPYSNICPLEGYECIPDDPVYVVYAGYVDSQTGLLYMRPYYNEYDGEELVGPWMSSLDAYEEGETPTSGAQVVDLGGDLETYELSRFMLQTLLRSLGIVQNFGSRTLMLNSLIDQATGRVREDDDLLDGLRIHIIGDVLPGDLIIKPGKPVKFTKEDL